MILAILIVAAIAASSPAPLATASPVPPLKTIEHVRSTPFCTALGENIKHSIETILADDESFKQSEPLFEQAANDLSYGGSDSRMVFDMNHLRDRGVAIAESLRKIDDLLNDTKRFPQNAATEEQRKLLALRDELQKIAKAQNQTLNIISGTAEEYALDDLFSRDVSFNGVLSASGAKSPDAGVFQGGPLSAAAPSPGPGAVGPAVPNPLRAAAPSMTLSGAQLNGPFKDPQMPGVAFNNALGRIYSDFVREEQHEQQLEAAFTPLTAGGGAL